MKRLTDWIHEGLRAQLRPGDWALDATLGNGHDAESLLECVGSGGQVWGIDVQAEALRAAQARLGERPNFHGFRGDHARLGELLPPEARGRLSAIVFNLGYLPGGDHGLTTQLESTIGALEMALDWLEPGGVLSCACYPGHPGGLEESEGVTAWFASVPADRGWVTRIERQGGGRPKPFLLWLERRGPLETS